MRLRREVGRGLSDPEFKKGFECYREAKKTQEIRNPAAWITIAAKRQFKMPADESKTIMEAAKKIERHFEGRGVREVAVYALSKYLEVSYPGHACPGKCFKYEGRTFSAWWEEVRGCLARYELPDLSNHAVHSL